MFHRLRESRLLIPSGQWAGAHATKGPHFSRALYIYTSPAIPLPYANLSAEMAKKVGPRLCVFSLVLTLPLTSFELTAQSIVPSWVYDFPDLAFPNQT